MEDKYIEDLINEMLDMIKENYEKEKIIPNPVDLETILKLIELKEKLQNNHL